MARNKARRPGAPPRSDRASEGSPARAEAAEGGAETSLRWPELLSSRRRPQRPHRGAGATPRHQDWLDTQPRRPAPARASGGARSGAGRRSGAEKRGGAAQVVSQLAGGHRRRRHRRRSRRAAGLLCRNKPRARRGSRSARPAQTERQPDRATGLRGAAGSAPSPGGCGFERAGSSPAPPGGRRHRHSLGERIASWKAARRDRHRRRRAVPPERVATLENDVADLGATLARLREAVPSAGAAGGQAVADLASRIDALERRLGQAQGAGAEIEGLAGRLGAWSSRSPPASRRPPG